MIDAFKITADLIEDCIRHEDGPERLMKLIVARKEEGKRASKEGSIKLVKCRADEALNSLIIEVTYDN